MPVSNPSIGRRTIAFALAAVAIVVGIRAASAEALLLVEANSGKVLHAENATYPWYPASVTKLMTAYVTLQAVKAGRISLDTLFTVSDVAAAQAPTKMGFRVGTQVTVDNALKMMMVKSANDMAVVLAEGVGGSIEGFAEEMNRTAARLGMTQTSYVNPNGLPADGQITSARDLAILARAIIRDLPEYEWYFHIPAIKFGRRVTHNYNPLIGRYPGADGMKTGFICASGFNLVGTATRDGRRLIAVVLGAYSGKERGEKAARLLEMGFHSNPLSWLFPSLGRVDGLKPVSAEPVNMRDEVCGPHRRRPAAEDEDDSAADDRPDQSSAYAGIARLRSGKSGPLLGPRVDSGPPVVVFTGAPKKSATRTATTHPSTPAASASASEEGSRRFGAKILPSGGFQMPEGAVPATQASVPAQENGAEVPVPKRRTQQRHVTRRKHPKPDSKTQAKTAQSKAAQSKTKPKAKSAAQ